MLSTEHRDNVYNLSIDGDFATRVYKVLTVDDDELYQQSLMFSLKNLPSLNSRLTILTASSAAEAAVLISENPDLAIIFVDVVMETDDAGLKLVSTIRQVLGNTDVRIILLTGQPGMAPLDDILSQYGIDDYWCKSDLQQKQLNTIAVTNLRTWYHMQLVVRARTSLLIIIEASRNMSSRADLPSFSRAILENIGKLITHKLGGIACLSASSEWGSLEEGHFVAAIGCYANLNNQLIKTLDQESIEFCQEAMDRKAHVFKDNRIVLYFESKIEKSEHYFILIDSPERISDFYISLLQVFSENVATEFKNILLVNRLTDLAYRDQALGTLNRNWILKSLDNMSAEEFSRSALMFLDINHYADMVINLGDKFCNDLVLKIYTNLRTTIPQLKDIGKLASDGFVLILDADQPLTAAELDSVTDQVVQFEGLMNSFPLTAALIPLKDMRQLSSPQLLRLGEALVDHARRCSQPYIEYDSMMADAIARRYQILFLLQQGLATDQIDIALQPKVDMESGKVVGLEALARWTLPDGTSISPVEFIPVAESGGLIHALGLLVLEKSYLAYQKLHLNGFTIPIAINVSVSQLLNDKNAKQLLDRLSDINRSGRVLDVEVTESESIQNYKQVFSFLNLLVHQGVDISLDDFGTGYSSLAHLSSLPANTLKIDKVFVDQMTENNFDDNGVVDTIIRLGERYHYGVIAEGVETEAQKSALLAKGCRLGQGYLFSKPLPVDQLLIWLQKSNWPGDSVS